jgi:Mn2+/Fe2+ NRAMP family transporter
MAQFIIFIILVILLTVFILARSENFSRAKKITICVLCVSLIVVIVIYQFFVDKRSDMDRELVNAFDRGEKLVCKEYEVDNKKFNYISGTKAFVGLDNFNDVKGAIIPIKECGLK